MPRPIDANALIQDFDRRGWDGVQTVVDMMPTLDAVPVVRCSECKRRHEFGCPMYYEEELEWDDDGYPEYDVLCHDHTFDDGFCDRGERKDGDG